MFRGLLVGLFFIIFLSCNSSKKIADNKVVVISEEDKHNGLALIAKNDCYACHSMDKELVGPSFPKIAGKYDVTQNNIGTLAKKIISGGNGVWGKIFMTPHPSMSQADAEVIVKYILLLKK
ncbi:MAG TPA: c-type cytochrome [Chitinophagaceae bacterium]|nr:c-type cytochrome [Chitinophagaceae bacterium]